MKRILVFFLACIIVTSSFAQNIWEWQINFDDSTLIDRILIDTEGNSTNLWQIGQPNKDLFKLSYSEPNAIMTDTIKSVPPNDTSIFYLFHVMDISFQYHMFYLNFWYQMDGDSTDVGFIEVSPDNGINWINLLNQDTIYGFYWMAPKPSLKGSTTGWQEFSINMDNWASHWGSFPFEITSDTILFRFTYISDSIANLSDGWIIDNIKIADFWENINETRNDNLILIYPNPVSDEFRINVEFPSSNQLIQIYNSTGQLQYSKKNMLNEIINIRHLKNGIYFLKYSDSKNYAIEKIIVNH